MKILKVTASLIIAAIVGSIIGTLVSSAHMLSNLSDLGVTLPSSAVIETISRDLTGLGPIMTVLLIPGFIIAFFAARLLANAVPTQRTLIYTVAGGVSVLTTFILIKTLLGVSGISAARSVTGLAGEGFAGLIAGFVFISLLDRFSPKEA